MKISKESIIGDLVALDYRTATVFKSNKIDFCCNGNRTIEEACDKINLQSDVLIKQLENVRSSEQSNIIDFNAWPIDLLADYIEKTHHRYVERKVQEILPFLEKVVRVHGPTHPELAEIESLFKGSAGELAQHMKKEELILFPYIRKMIAAKNNEGIQPASFGTIVNPINVMMTEHDGEGERFRRIALLSNDYTPPSDACNTYRVTFAMLKEFEDNLHEHIHLENNILFPKAIEMENGVLS